MEIWYNPACSKCRASEEILDAAGVTYTERRYLDSPPTADEIEQVLDLLGIEPWDLTRMDEPRRDGHCCCASGEAHSGADACGGSRAFGG